MKRRSDRLRQMPSNTFRLYGAGTAAGPGADTVVVMTIGEHGQCICHEETAGAHAASPEQSVRRNHEEYRRACAEQRVWEDRVRVAPLGFVQQDYLVYYEEVIDRYRAWFAAHEVNTESGEDAH